MLIKPYPRYDPDRCWDRHFEYPLQMQAYDRIEYFDKVDTLVSKGLYRRIKGITGVIGQRIQNQTRNRCRICL